MKQSYIISILHPEIPGQWDFIGSNRQDCIDALRQRFPKGGYRIIEEKTK